MEETFDKVLAERLAFLEESKYSHFNIAKILSGEVAPLDIYAFMVLKRSICLVIGYTDMIRNRNFVCAAPLIRLQIDNLLRFRCAFLVENQSKFVAEIIMGKEVRKIRDRLGKNMTDAYLQDVLSKDYPWLRSLYKKTSGYIHLSEEHFFNTLQAKKDGKRGEFQIYIGPDDQWVSDDIYQEATEDMILVTHSLLTYLTNWTPGKEKS